MQPLVTAAEMRGFDEHTIRTVGVPALSLMESAGRAVADEVDRLTGGRVIAVCGTGNNGGDGMVAARTLVARGRGAKIVLVGDESRLGDQPRACFEAAKKAGVIVERGIEALERALNDQPDAVVLDALLGTGLSREVEGDAKKAIELMTSHGHVLAVDIPSGLDSDRGQPLGVATTCDVTVTFAFGKRGLFAAPGFTYAGRIVVADIGIARLLADDVALRLLDESVLDPFRARDPLGHKGTHGHVLLVAGSVGKIGASLLAGRAALRSGAGLVTLATPAAAQARVEGKLPELMTLAYPGVEEGGKALDVAKASSALVQELTGKRVVAIGPGVPTAPAFAEVVEKLVYASIAEGLTIILDADALNHLAHRESVLVGRPGSGAVILTPHPGEAARLLGKKVPEVEADRFASALAIARKYDAVVALKGARTIIAAPDGRMCLCAAGGPILGQGGTGDVLTGAAAALAANRKAPPFETACAAVYLHATTADRLAAGVSRGVLAGDLADALPHTF